MGIAAEFLIKREILKTVLDNKFLNYQNQDQIQKHWDEISNNEEYEDYLYDETSEFRCSGEETNLSPCHGSRHYECEQVAKKLRCGNTVCWTYWHGGGKHGDPSAMEWMYSSYLVECKEEEKLVIVKTYTKK